MPRQPKKAAKSGKRVGRKVRGRGDYSVNKSDVNPLVNQIVRKVGSAIGGIGGGFFGQPTLGAYAGDYIANKGHKLFKRITGYGDYKINSNTLVLGDNVPQFSNIGQRENRIVHKEYIGDLYCGPNGEFKLQSFKVNPGTSTIFPWLSGLAQNYQQYRINGMIFYYKSCSANALNSTNTNLGQVLISTNYNVLSRNFDEPSEMLNAEFSTSGKPSDDMVHMIECAPRETPIKELYIRNSGVPVDEIADNRLYDYCNIQVATVGMQSSTPIMLGQLWVSYDITLMKNISSQNILLSDQYVFDEKYYPTTSAEVFCSTVDVIAAGGPMEFRSPASTLGTTIKLGPDGAFDTIVFPETFQGSVRIDTVAYGGTGTTLNATPVLLYTGGVSPMKMYENRTVAFATDMNSGLASPAGMFSVYLNVKNVGTQNTVRFTNWKIPSYLKDASLNLIITTVPVTMDKV